MQTTEINEMPKGGTETILVADDDEMLRKLAGSVLGEFGYTVILAEDGDDAIQKFMENKDTIRLVILDMLMPKKNGKEVYDAIKILKPDTRILFVSGYTADIIHQEDILDSHLDFVMKPISPIALLKKIREILDR